MKARFSQEPWTVNELREFWRADQVKDQARLLDVMLDMMMRRIIEPKLVREEVLNMPAEAFYALVCQMLTTMGYAVKLSLEQLLKDVDLSGLEKGDNRANHRS